MYQYCPDIRLQRTSNGLWDIEYLTDGYGPRIVDVIQRYNALHIGFCGCPHSLSGNTP